FFEMMVPDDIAFKVPDLKLQAIDSVGGGPVHEHRQIGQHRIPAGHNLVGGTEQEIFARAFVLKDLPAEQKGLANGRGRFARHGEEATWRFVGLAVRGLPGRCQAASGAMGWAYGLAGGFTTILAAGRSLARRSSRSRSMYTSRTRSLTSSYLSFLPGLVSRT